MSGGSPHVAWCFARIWGGCLSGVLLCAYNAMSRPCAGLWVPTLVPHQQAGAGAGSGARAGWSARSPHLDRSDVPKIPAVEAGEAASPGGAAAIPRGREVGWVPSNPCIHMQQTPASFSGLLVWSRSVFISKNSLFGRFQICASYRQYWLFRKTCRYPGYQLIKPSKRVKI